MGEAQGFVTDEKKNYSCTIYAVVIGEIRKISDEAFKFNEKEFHRLRLSIDDENDERMYLVDRDPKHKELYKRGMKGKFTIRIDVDDGYKGKTKIHIVGFEVVND